MPNLAAQSYCKVVSKEGKTLEFKTNLTNKRLVNKDSSLAKGEISLTEPAGGFESNIISTLASILPETPDNLKILEMVAKVYQAKGLVNHASCAEAANFAYQGGKDKFLNLLEGYGFKSDMKLRAQRIITNFERYQFLQGQRDALVKEIQEEDPTYKFQ